MPDGRELMVSVVFAVVAIALLIGLVRAVLEQLSEERRKKLERQPPLPLPPADLRCGATPPALSRSTEERPQRR